MVPDYRGSPKLYKGTARVRFGKSKKAKIREKYLEKIFHEIAMCCFLFYSKYSISPVSILILHKRGFLSSGAL